MVKSLSFQLWEKFSDMMDSGRLVSISVGELSAEEWQAWLRGSRNLRRENGLGCTLSALVTDGLAEHLESKDQVVENKGWSHGGKKNCMIGRVNK